METFSLNDNDWTGITLTAAAAKQIVTLMKNTGQYRALPECQTIRLCGFGYVFEMINQADAEDMLFERDGARLYVPRKAMPFIDGTEVDFVREGLNQIFKFNNPKAQHACGCGESFGV